MRLQVFCCEVEAIYSTLLQNEELMLLFFSLLDAPQPLDCLAAGYFNRIISCILMKRVSEFMGFLEVRAPNSFFLKKCSSGHMTGFWESEFGLNMAARSLGGKS